MNTYLANGHLFSGNTLRSDFESDLFYNIDFCLIPVGVKSNQVKK